MAGRYDSNYGSTVISSIPLEEYCSHEWDDGKVTISPSCENTGKKEYTCTKCNETKIETIPALGHEWKEWEIWAEKEESGRCLLEFAKEVCYTVSITYRKQGGAQNGKEF